MFFGYGNSCFCREIITNFDTKEQIIGRFYFKSKKEKDTPHI